MARSEFQCIKGLVRLAIRRLVGDADREPGARSGYPVLAGSPRSAGSVAMSPVGSRLALSVGKRLSVADITDGPWARLRFQMACAPAPGLAWSSDGEKLAFRDDVGQMRLADLSGQLSPGRGGNPGAGARDGELPGLRSW